MNILWFIFVAIINVAVLLVLDEIFFDSNNIEKKRRNFWIKLLIVVVLDFVLFSIRGDWI